MMRNTFHILVIMSLMVIGGCNAMGTSDFSCSAPTPGVSCLPANEVYEITNDPELYEAVDAALQAAAKSGEDYDPQEIVKYVRATYKPTVDVTKPMAEPVKQPLPVLKPAHVIRIWMDAWVDNKGDLHMPGYVFSEITPRRWSFGEPAVSQSTVLAPLQVDRSNDNTNGAQSN